MDFHRFLSDTEDYLIPPNLRLSVFSEPVASLVESFIGIRADTVEWKTFSRLVYQLSDFEDGDIHYHRGRANSMMQCLAEEMIIQRDLGMFALTATTFVACNTYEGLIKTFDRRPVPDSRVFRILGELPGNFTGTHFYPGPNTQSLAAFYFGAALTHFRKIEAYQLACYRQIPLGIGGILRLKGWAAAEHEVERLFDCLESRPCSRYPVTSAIISSSLPKNLYMLKLSRADRGLALEQALGL